MARGGTILLAERDQLSTQILLFILQRAGFTVLPAAGGADLLALAEHRRVDCIVTEVHLPDADGMAVCRQLRAGWSTRCIPIVLLASYDDPEGRLQGLRAGADHYLSKPFDPEELVLSLQHLIAVYGGCTQFCPVTRLPGPAATQAFVTTQCLLAGAPSWAFLYLDLHYLQRFNEIYGYAAGDAVLALVADVLRAVVLRAPPGLRFAGALGGGCFAAIVPRAECGPICEALIAEFDARVPGCYPPERRAAAADAYVPRRGPVQQVRHVSLAIGVVLAEQCATMSYRALEDLARAVVRPAKAVGRSAYYINRRRPAPQPVPGSST